eukprot:3819_1
MSRREEIGKKEVIVNGYIREIGLWKITFDIAKICLLYYDAALYFKFDGKLYTQTGFFYETPRQYVNGIIFNLVFHGNKLLHKYLSYYLSMYCSLAKVCSVGICYSLNCTQNGKYFIDSGRLLTGDSLTSHSNINCSIMLNHNLNDNTFVVECNYNILFIEYYSDNIDDDTHFKFITDYNYKPAKLKTVNWHEIELTGQILTDLTYADSNYVCQQTFMKNDECFCIEYGLDAYNGLEVSLKLLRLPASILKIKLKYQVIHNYPYTSRRQTKCHAGVVKLGYQFNKIVINMDVMLSELKMLLSSLTIAVKFSILDLYGVDEETISKDQWSQFGVNR